MPIKIRCPVGHSLAVPERYAGRAVRCPACGTSVPVPGARLVNVSDRPAHVGATPIVARQPDASPRDASRRAASQLGIPQQGVPQQDVPQQDVSQQDVSQQDVSQQDVSQHNVARVDVPRVNASIVHMSHVNTSPVDVPGVAAKHSASDAASTIAPIPVPVESVTARYHRRRPVRLDGGQYAAWQLSACLALMAALTLAPVVVTLAQTETEWAVFRLPAWCYVIGALGLVHGAHAIFLAQMPDWTSVWAVAQFCLAAAAAYGVGLALGLFGTMSNGLLARLDLLDHRLSGSLARWCLIQVCLWTVMTYATGRTALRWRRLHRLRSA